MVTNRTVNLILSSYGLFSKMLTASFGGADDTAFDQTRYVTEFWRKTAYP